MISDLRRVAGSYGSSVFLHDIVLDGTMTAEHITHAVANARKMQNVKCKVQSAKRKTAQPSIIGWYMNYKVSLGTARQ